MIQNGTFRSSQYVDLLSQSYAPQEKGSSPWSWWCFITWRSVPAKASSCWSTGSTRGPLLQDRVDQAKVAEWQTLIDKGAVRIVPAGESRWIRKNQSNRIMGSRFVIVKKPAVRRLSKQGSSGSNQHGALARQGMMVFTGTFRPWLVWQGSIGTATVSTCPKLAGLHCFSWWAT